MKTFPWDAVLSTNQALCEKQHLAAQNQDRGCTKAKQIWEQAAAREITLLEALDTCRKCEELLPFVFNNANTFATVASQLIEDLAAELPALEAHIVRTTVAHYVAGVVVRKELVQVLGHFGKGQKVIQRPTAIIQPLPAKPPLESGVA